MKKTTLILASFIFGAVSCLLSACTKWKDGSPGNVWEGGLWLVFWIPFIAAVVCWLLVWRSMKSPFMAYDKSSNKWYEVAPKTPFFKVRYTPWAIGLTIATILIYITVTVWEN